MKLHEIFKHIILKRFSSIGRPDHEISLSFPGLQIFWKEFLHITDHTNISHILIHICACGAPRSKMLFIFIDIYIKDLI